MVLLGVFMRVSKREIPEQLRSQERVRKDVNGGQGRSEGPSYCRAVPRAPLPLRTDGGLSFPTQLSPSRSDTTPMSPGAPRPMHIALTRQPLYAPPAVARCQAGAGVDLPHPPSALQGLTRATRASTGLSDSNGTILAVKELRLVLQRVLRCQKTFVRCDPW